MPVFVEDPAQFSKPRLKSELIAHNVTLPAAVSNKHVYMELYSKSIGLKSAADFSSDEEDVQESQDCEEEKPKDPEMIDPCGLTDKELKTALLQYGVEAGPIVATTRSLYERKLQRLTEPAGARQRSETTGDADRYSYSEDELEDNSDSEGQAETVAFVGEKQHVDGDVQVPIKDVLMEMFPETKLTPTGISATRRRPIKGAAGRPVRFQYPDLPASPMARQRQAVEHHMVPLWVQILVFLVLGCLLFVIYTAMETSLDSPFVSLLDNLSMATETETKGMSLQA